MASIHTAGRRFMQRYRLSDGRYILGSIDEPANSPAPNYEFAINRRVLITAENSIATAGNIMLDKSNNRFLLALNGQAQFYDRKAYKNFRLVELNEYLQISTRKTIIDTVTGVAREDTSVPAGSHWVAKESIKGQVDFAFRVDENQFRIITNYPLSEKDKVGDYLVEKVNYLLGVYVAEVR